MDLQLVGAQHATNVYVGGYMTKCETEGLPDRVEKAMDRLPANSTAKQRYFRIGTALLAGRECSQQEQTYLTCGLPLRGSSRQVESLCVAYPEKRPRLLNVSAIHAATTSEAQEEDNPFEDDYDEEEGFGMGRGGASTMQLGKFDFYRHRPDDLEHLTLAQFVRYSFTVYCYQAIAAQRVAVVLFKHRLPPNSCEIITVPSRIFDDCTGNIPSLLRGPSLVRCSRSSSQVAARDMPDAEIKVAPFQKRHQTI